MLFLFLPPYPPSVTEGRFAMKKILGLILGTFRWIVDVKVHSLIRSWRTATMLSRKCCPTWTSGPMLRPCAPRSLIHLTQYCLQRCAPEASSQGLFHHLPLCILDVVVLGIETGTCGMPCHVVYLWALQPFLIVPPFPANPYCPPRIHPLSDGSSHIEMVFFKAPLQYCAADGIPEEHSTDSKYQISTE